MAKGRWAAIIGRFVGQVLLLNPVFAALAGAFCWVTGQRTVGAWSTALAVVGVLAVALGFIGFTTVGENLGRTSPVEMFFPRGPDVPPGAAADRAVLGVAGFGAITVASFLATLQ